MKNKPSITPVRLLSVVVTMALVLISCGGDDYQLVSSQLDAAQGRLGDLNAHLQDLKTECLDLTESVSCEIDTPTTTAPASSQSTSPSNTASDSKIVCLQSNSEGCVWELSLPNDPGCNAQTSSSEKDFALLPCEYSYWIGYLESRLTTLGTRISKDGYYASDEIDLIKGAQRRLGVGDDGLIGSKTWRAAFSEIDCFQFDPSTGEPSSMQDCYNDTNGDGMYGPGDEVPS